MLWLLACGHPERDHPLDPGASDKRQEIQLIAFLPDDGQKIQNSLLFAFYYQVSERDTTQKEVVLARGEMNRVGEQLTALVPNVPDGPQRIFRVDVFDLNQIRTFSAVQTADIGPKYPHVVQLALERLKGDLELTSQLPPEVDTLEVIVVADGDSLRRAFGRTEAEIQRIAGIPTGTDVELIFQGRDPKNQVLIDRRAFVDIRDNLLARFNLLVQVGALQVIAHFPDYLPIAVVDRFSDAAGTFFRRSERPELPGPGEPIDFDQEAFLWRGYGPNGERVLFYHFDVRSPTPAPVYLLTDRRGKPIAGQLLIFDRLPGEEGHNDLWQIHQVQITDREYQPNALTSYQALYERGYPIVPTSEVMNCVMVPPGSRASRRFDPQVPAALQDGWYRDQIVKYFLFEHPQSTARVSFSGDRLIPQQMYAFLENDRDLVDGFARDETGSTHNVVAVLPGQGGEADYSPLWLLRILRLRAFDRVTNLSSASDQTLENLNPELANLRINAPIVAVE